jgi:outer membrane receptor for ferrienterochelin and colicins
MLAAAICISAAVVAPVAPVGAQQASGLSGRVVDASSHAPLEGAALFVDGSDSHVRSGTDGRWRLSSLTQGAHAIQVRMIGYSNFETTITLPSSAAHGVTIALVPSKHALDAVVVTASRRAQRLQDAPVSMTRIDRHDIVESGASDVASVLTEQTGIQFTGGHPTGSGVALEGMSDQRVLILVDGVPLYGRIADGLDLTRIPSSAVERIEVVKGPQSTLYGSEAMGGVVNIITRTGVAAAPNMEASVVVGSDNRTDAHVYGSGQMGLVSGALDVGVRHIDNTPGVEHTSGAFADRRDGMGSLRWTPSASVAFDASALLVNERQRWPTGGANDFADNTQSNTRLRGTWMHGESQFSSTLSLSRLDHLLRTSAFNEPIKGTGDRQIQRLGQADVLYTGPMMGGTFDVGSQFRQEYIMSTDGRVSGGSRTIFSAEPYVQGDWTVGRWSIVPGVRVAWNEQYGVYASPRIATRFRIDSSLTLRASAGRGFRAPDFKELYLDFTNDAAFYAVHGNPDLKPEHADNVSVGAEWTGTRSYARTTLYWNEMRDFIETRPLPNVGSFLQFTYGNISRSTTRGADTEAGILIGSVQTDVGYGYLYSRDPGTAGPLLGLPAHSGRVRITTPLLFGLRGSVIGVYTGSTPMDRAEDGSISSTRDPYTRMDLRLSRLSFGHADISIGVQNLFDAHPKRWADATDRQIYAGITLRAHGAPNTITQ